MNSTTQLTSLNNFCNSYTYMGVPTSCIGGVAIGISTGYFAGWALLASIGAVAAGALALSGTLFAACGVMLLIFGRKVNYIKIELSESNNKNQTIQIELNKKNEELAAAHLQISSLEAEKRSLANKTSELEQARNKLDELHKRAESRLTSQDNTLRACQAANASLKLSIDATTELLANREDALKKLQSQQKQQHRLHPAEAALNKEDVEELNNKLDEADTDKQELEENQKKESSVRVSSSNTCTPSLGFAREQIASAAKNWQEVGVPGNLQTVRERRQNRLEAVKSVGVKAAAAACERSKEKVNKQEATSSQLSHPLAPSVQDTARVVRDSAAVRLSFSVIEPSNAFKLAVNGQIDTATLLSAQKEVRDKQFTQQNDARGISIVVTPPDSTPQHVHPLTSLLNRYREFVQKELARFQSEVSEKQNINCIAKLQSELKILNCIPNFPIGNLESDQKFSVSDSLDDLMVPIGAPDFVCVTRTGSQLEADMKTGGVIDRNNVNLNQLIQRMHVKWQEFLGRDQTVDGLALEKCKDEDWVTAYLIRNRIGKIKAGALNKEDILKLVNTDFNRTLNTVRRFNETLQEGAIAAQILEKLQKQAFVKPNTPSEDIPYEIMAFLTQNIGSNQWSITMRKILSTEKLTLICPHHLENTEVIQYQLLDTRNNGVQILHAHRFIISPIDAEGQPQVNSPVADVVLYVYVDYLAGKAYWGLNHFA